MYYIIKNYYERIGRCKGLTDVTREKTGAGNYLTKPASLGPNILFLFLKHKAIKILKTSFKNYF